MMTQGHPIRVHARLRCEFREAKLIHIPTTPALAPRNEHEAAKRCATPDEQAEISFLGSPAVQITRDGRVPTDERDTVLHTRVQTTVHNAPLKCVCDPPFIALHIAPLRGY